MTRNGGPTRGRKKRIKIGSNIERQRPTGATVKSLQGLLLYLYVKEDWRMRLNELPQLGRNV